MDEKKNPGNNRLSEQLPVHSPDAESWQRLSAKLDTLDAETVYQEKLKNLPQHSPDQGTWKIIYARLNRISYYKTASRIALSAAAGLLLFFTVTRISDYYQTPDYIPQLTKHEQPVILHDGIWQEKSIAQKEPNNKTTTDKPQVPKTENQIGTLASFQAETEKVVSEPEQNPGTQEIALHAGIPAGAENIQQAVAQITPAQDASVQSEAGSNGILSTDTEPKIAVVQPLPSKAEVSTKKYYTPKEPPGKSRNNHFDLAMNYLPENIYNGTDNSLFHNVDLTASYNKEKVRFNTSLGMAYNEEQLEFDMNYDIKTPITANGVDGHVDTLGFNISTMESQYQGTEKHQYFTYNLGIGRRLFSVGKFSTWINAGAGIGIRLNDPDIISSTEQTIKGQYYSAHITSVNTSKPVYNDVNVNFVTGIDFNYKVLNRLSISFTPTSRWYFKPVLTKDNQPTDELTLGFRTGLKFDF